MTKESFHAKIMKAEELTIDADKSLAIVKSTLEQYGTSQQGAAVFEIEKRENELRKWFLDILKEADSMYQQPKKTPSNSDETMP
jgi:hypothetical protein